MSYILKGKKTSKKIDLRIFLKKSIFRGLINLSVVGCLWFCVETNFVSCMDDSVEINRVLCAIDFYGIMIDFQLTLSKSIWFS